MAERFRPIATNFTPVDVVGVPGLMLVVVAIALAVQFPEARWILLAGIAGGVLVAAALIAGRRNRSGGDDGHDSRGVLQLEEPAPTRPEAASPRSERTQLCLPALEAV